jgi:hypothetical protein
MLPAFATTKQNVRSSHIRDRQIQQRPTYRILVQSITVLPGRSGGFSRVEFLYILSGFDEEKHSVINAIVREQVCLIRFKGLAHLKTPPPT